MIARGLPKRVRLYVIDNAGLAVHRILCTALASPINVDTISGSRIFTRVPSNSSKLLSDAVSAGGHIVLSHQAGESWTTISSANSHSTQNGVHNSGIT